MSEKDNHSLLRKSQIDNATIEMTELLKEIDALDEKVCLPFCGFISFDEKACYKAC